MNTLTQETLSMAILDSGCTKRVCSKTWLKCYLRSLISEEYSLTDNSDKLPKARQYVEFQLHNEDKWNKCQIIFRAVKATTKYKHLFNTINLSNETIHLIDYSKTENGV